MSVVMTVVALLLLLPLLSTPAGAVVNFPGVEVNVAMGQRAHASSYYDYAPNVLRDTVFVPGNAIDGFVDETSWWSAGGEEKPFWQMNLTAQPPKLSRIIIRWHGFQSPASYRVRVSNGGENFQTVAVVANRSIEYDRVDTITAGLDKVDTRFRFLRLVFDAANVCADEFSCADPPDAAKVASTGESVIYGIREFELWVTGSKSGALAWR
ncbi:hypothetical protein PybrP1_002307 [[Pythium] brassicae (nom. inval.)]|nr:hypothetical protein PybrP1_002307 [[Pythium] brassicae (nom. inval.)]